MSIEGFLDVPRDLREWSRWLDEATVTADLTAPDAVGTAAIQDNAVTASKIPDAEIDLAKLEDLSADVFLGRLTTGGATQQLTPTQVTGTLQGETWSFSGAVTFSGTVGFFGAAAVSQQTAPSALSLTDVSGTGDDATINANQAAVEAAVNAIRTALNNLGLTA